MDNNVNKTEVIDEAEVVREYAEEYMPKVHRIGRLTTVLSFVLAFVPVFYLLVIRGYMASMSVYVDVIIAVVAYNIGAWIINPPAHFTVLGAASTYMSYLAGNVANMRIPVAMSVQYSTKSDINTPKGQIITTIGVATTVVVNLIIVFICVIAGSAILNILPQAVITSFKYITATLFGSMLMMKIVSDPKHSFQYMVPAVIVFIISRFVPFVKTYGTGFSILIPIIFAYLLFRTTEGKKAAPDDQTPVDID
ncbi:MAG: hypothetical protein IJJ29_03070 [Solobacterium sp.]|nr:hypothetical protein [Solobacterium sp.]